MKTMILIGAGQMGQAALRLVNRTTWEVTAFADNSKKLQGGTLCGLPILSVEEAAAQQPDCILIAVAGEERTEQLRSQLGALGCTGEIRTLAEYQQALDIRGAVFELLAEQLAALPGDLAELGVYQGEFAARMSRCFPDRTLYLFDTFEGFDARDVSVESQSGYSRAVEGEFADTSVDLILSKMAAPERVVVRKGYFPETIPEEETSFALVSLDADLYEPTLQGLRYFYPRLVSGGVILLHDYRNARFSGVCAAVEAFEQENGRMLLLPVGDLHGTAMIIHP